MNCSLLYAGTLATPGLQLLVLGDGLDIPYCTGFAMTGKAEALRRHAFFVAKFWVQPASFTMLSVATAWEHVASKFVMLYMESPHG